MILNLDRSCGPFCGVIWQDKMSNKQWIISGIGEHGYFRWLIFYSKYIIADILLGVNMYWELIGIVWNVLPQSSGTPKIPRTPSR